MTTKVVEANDGVFSTGMAVAPVTDWRYYGKPRLYNFLGTILRPFFILDSVYTERYMKTPALNPQGYVDSAVNNMTGFRDTKYLLAHGTGDDNGKRKKYIKYLYKRSKSINLVHFQHTAVLVDKLTLEDIHNYRVQIFPDSNHAIRHHNANKNVYYLLTEFLIERYYYDK